MLSEAASTGSVKRERRLENMSGKNFLSGALLVPHEVKWNGENLRIRHLYDTIAIVEKDAPFETAPTEVCKFLQPSAILREDGLGSLHFDRPCLVKVLDDEIDLCAVAVSRYVDSVGRGLSVVKNTNCRIAETRIVELTSRKLLI